MARNNGPLIPDEELTTRREPAASKPDDSAFDARFHDLDPENQSPFLRGQKRVPVRRGPLAKKTAGRVKIIAIAVVGIVLVSGAAAFVYRYGAQSWRFRI